MNKMLVCFETAPPLLQPRLAGIPVRDLPATDPGVTNTLPAEALWLQMVRMRADAGFARDWRLRC